MKNKKTLIIVGSIGIVAIIAAIIFSKKSGVKVGSSFLAKALQSGDGVLTAEYMGMSQEDFDAYQASTKAKIDAALYTPEELRAMNNAAFEAQSEEW